MRPKLGEGAETVGEIVVIRVLTALMRAHELPEGVRVTWNEADNQQVSNAEGIFYKYLKEGWIAFSEDVKERKQIFKFDPSLTRIVLIPPIGGG